MKNLSQNNFFFLAIGGLIFFGLLMLSSASAVISSNKWGDDYYLLKQQALNGLIPGLILFFAAGYFPYRKLKKFAMPLMLASIFLLALLFVPGLGVSIKGATRWLNLGIISFQPSEILKLAVIVYLAALFESHKKNSSDEAKGKFLPFAVISAVITALLISQPDLGTLGVVLGIAFMMYFAVGAKAMHILAVALLGLAGLAVFIVMSGHGLDRIEVFLNPHSDKLGSGYQISQAMGVIASGGYFGLGFGAFQEKAGSRLPEPMGDSIFAIVAQEMGFAGVLAITALLVTLGWYGLKIAKSSRDEFGALLVTGVIVWILIQSFINIGAISGFLPLTGIPLPFVSYGGTSLAILLTACGIVYNIQKTSLN